MNTTPDPLNTAALEAKDAQRIAMLHTGLAGRLELSLGSGCVETCLQFERGSGYYFLHPPRNFQMCSPPADMARGNTHVI